MNLDKMTKEQMLEKIETERASVKELDANYPEFELPRGGTAWHIHHTKVRDCYWRIRMLQTKLEDGDINQTAQVW